MFDDEEDTMHENICIQTVVVDGIPMLMYIRSGFILPMKMVFVHETNIKKILWKYLSV